MTQAEINLFIAKTEEVYPPKHPMGEIAIAAWNDLLEAIDYQSAINAVKDMISAPNKKRIYGFPEPADLKPFLMSVHTSTNCPCCNNSRWLVWWLGNRGVDATPAYACKCATSYPTYGKHALNICNNLNCQNKGGAKEIHAPPGYSEKYRQLFTACKHKPAIITA